MHKYETFEIYKKVLTIEKQYTGAKNGQILRFQLYQNIVNKDYHNCVLLYKIYVNFTGAGGAVVDVPVCSTNMCNLCYIFLYICVNL